MRKLTISRFSSSLAIACMILLLGAPEAFAAQSLGALASGWKSMFGSLADAMGSFVFLLGIGTAIGAALKFKAHGEDPRQTPLKPCLIYTVAAAAMIGLPMMLGVGVASIFGGDTSGVLSATSGLQSIR